jgi:dephospho-CoA kinase
MSETAPDSDAGATPDRDQSDIRPAKRSVLLLAPGWLGLSLVLFAACVGAIATGRWPEHLLGLLLVPIASVLGVLSSAAVVRNAMLYQLTSDRVRALGGVFSRVFTEARLEHVQNVTVERSFLQRILTLGTIEMTTAGIGPSIIWRHVADPAATAERLRKAIDAAHLRRGEAIPPPVRPIHPSVDQSVPSSSPRRVPVIGLAGGIGAGKSTVAGIFQRLGCLVVDSDAKAKAALDRPDVRRTLVGWWGEGILSPDGRINRSRVASIVFGDPAQRSKLEQLVHPIVREDRAAMVREAIAARAAAVVVDAPLLFEAGVDAECDFAVFVDAPRADRLERIRQSRDWEEAELDRREAAQLPLDQKRRRCRFVVDNHGNLGNLQAQISQILAQTRAED